ncbi:MAG: PAS domain S-box protein, partial [Ignavibacteria bacterium]|nr:PAS domain S-box protein [Ignavibacteria bacterium]
MVWHNQQVRFYNEKYLAEKRQASLQNIISKSLNEIYVFDAATLKFIYVNDGALANLGYSMVELAKMTPHDIKPRFNITSFKEMAAPLFENKISVLLFETIHRRKDGSEYDVEVHLQLIDSEIGLVFLAIVNDITERKRAEETLIERENFLNTLLDAIPIPVFYKDNNGRYLGVNKAYETFFGTSRNELIGKTVFEISPPELAEIYNAKDIELLENGVNQQYEFQIKTKKDLIRDVIFNKAVFTGNSGKVEGLIGTILDITERKQAEKTLHESDAKLDEAMKIAKLSTWEYDVDLEQFIFNDQFYSLLHTTAEREGGYTMSPLHYAQKFVHPDDFALVGVETQKALETTDPNYYSCIDHRIICADGEIGYINVNIKIAKDIHGRTVKTYGVNQVITERKQSEDELRIREAYLSAIIENQPGLVWLKNTDGRFLAVNKAFAVSCGGQTAADVVGKTDYDIWPPE